MPKRTAEESGGATLDCFSVKDQNIIEHDYILATEKIVRNTPSLYGDWEKICSSVELRESNPAHSMANPEEAESLQLHTLDTEVVV